PHARSARVLRAIADVAQTLVALHDAAFVHGDLKPAHVRIPKAGGRAVVLDLGAAVAQRSQASERALTPAFAATEVQSGDPPSPRSDLYSLGATLWTAATGAVASTRARL